MTELTRAREALRDAHDIIYRLSDHLTDEGTDWSSDGLDMMRRRVANALPIEELPDWLHRYRARASSSATQREPTKEAT